MIVITKSWEEHAKVKNIFNIYGIKKESEETFIVYNKDFDYTKYKYLSIFTYEQFLKVAEHLLSTGEDLSLNSKKLDPNGDYVVCFSGDSSNNEETYTIPSNFIFKTKDNKFLDIDFIEDLNGDENGWSDRNPLHFRLATEEEKQMFIKAGRPVDVSKTEPIKIPAMSLYGTFGTFEHDISDDKFIGDSIDNGSIKLGVLSNGFLVTGSRTAIGVIDRDYDIVISNSILTLPSSGRYYNGGLVRTLQINKFPLIKPNDDNNTNDVPLLNLKKITKLNLIN